MASSLSCEHSRCSFVGGYRSGARRFFLVLLFLTFSAHLQAEELSVTFRLNDAYVKDRMLDQVEVQVHATDSDEVLAFGTTDSDGLVRFDLPAGNYAAQFSRPRYIPLETSFALDRDGQIITTTLSMMLEAEGSVGINRIRIILNWGADESLHVRDVDAHLLCQCDDAAHVYFGEREHHGAGHDVDLDVDDMDWGGPETVTLRDPPEGRYLYWLHDYSNGPGDLGSSEITVRVLFGDRVVGELRPPTDLDGRYWRPFDAIEVGSDLEARLVFLPAGSESGESSRKPPVGYETESPDIAITPAFLLFALSVSIFTLVIFMVRRRFR